MKTRIPFVAGLIFTLLVGTFFATLSQTRARGRAWKQQAGIQQSFSIEGQTRTAIIYQNTVAAPDAGAPVVFVFHGHGGTAKNAARKFQIHERWPDAVVVYMQGIPGVSGITDPAGVKNGWQKNPGELNDRDVKFFDAVLPAVETALKTDPTRVYLLGHSNGARFANVLWTLRGEKIAALCSAAAQGGTLLRDVPPRSIFMVAGEKDPLVSYDQQLLSVEYVRQMLQTDPSKAIEVGYGRLEPGIDGLELGTYLHPGGHEFPEPALDLSVKFFQRHSLPVKPTEE